MPSGLSATTKDQLIMGAGLLVVGTGPAPFAPTRGGVRTTLTEEWRNPAFDGMVSPIAGNDRVVGYEATIVASLIEVSAAKILTLRPGTTSGVVGTVTTVTRPAANAYLAAVSNVRAVYPLGNGDLYIVWFPKARASWTSIAGEDRGEGSFEVTFTALLNYPTLGVDAVPFVEQIVASPGGGVMATIPTLP